MHKDRAACNKAELGRIDFWVVDKAHVSYNIIFYMARASVQNRFPIKVGFDFGFQILDFSSRLRYRNLKSEIQAHDIQSMTTIIEQVG